VTELVSGSAIVTGAGSGIGRAIALKLAEAGVPVALVDLEAEGARETASAIIESKGRSVFLQADVSKAAEVDEAVQVAVTQLGPLGILVNAAGILDGYTPTAEMTLELWERVLSINLTGTFLGCKRALSEFGGRQGRIINIASVAGLVGAGGGPAYIASKHGVVGLTRYLAVNHADGGMTVNAICPGPVLTGLRTNSARILGWAPGVSMMGGIGADEAALRAVVPVGRRGTVDEIAALACFLASKEAGYITGQTLVASHRWRLDSSLGAARCCNSEG